MTEREHPKAPSPISGEYESYYNKQLRETIEPTLNKDHPLAQETKDGIARIVGGECGLLEISGAVASQLAKLGVLRPVVTVFVPTATLNINGGSAGWFESFERVEQNVRTTAVVTDYAVELDSKIPPSSHPQTRLELRAAGGRLQKVFTCWVLERRKIEFNQ